MALIVLTEPDPVEALDDKLMKRCAYRYSPCLDFVCQVLSQNMGRGI